MRHLWFWWFVTTIKHGENNTVKKPKLTMDWGEGGGPLDTGSNMDSADEDELEAQATTCHDEEEGPMFTGCKTRTKNKYLQSGWSNEGKMFYKKALIALTTRERETNGPSKL